MEHEVLEPADLLEIERLKLTERALKVLRAATTWPKHALIAMYGKPSVYQLSNVELVDMIERHARGIFWTDPRLAHLPETWNKGRR